MSKVRKVSKDSKLSNWCGFKTAYAVDIHSELSDDISDQKNMIWRYFDKSGLPDTWALLGTEISGAAGFVLLFEFENFATQEDLNKVEEIIKEYG